MANLRTAIGAALVVAMSAHAALAQHLLYTYGATLGTGPDWTGLETRMAPNLTASGGVGGLYQLNGTYNIYVATASDGIGGCPVVFEVDTLLTEMSWWPDVLASRVHSVSSGPFDTMYNACPQGQGIEVTLNNDGTLTLVDLFAGGIRDEITIALFFCTLPHDPSGEGCHENRYVYITLMPPGRKNRIVSCSPEGFVTQPFDALPGTVVNVASLHEGFWRINVPALVVEWVSTDVAGVSARQVDGGDLAALSQELGYPVRWGFPTETLPYPNAPSTNFRVNFALFGELGVGGTADHIDSQDVAAFAADFSTSCGSSKSQADGSSELQDLMAWFGFVATGRVVAIDPETVAPEYDLHDWIQNRRAILDPYGYRRTEAGTAAVRATWSVVKRVYR